MYTIMYTISLQGLGQDFMGCKGDVIYQILNKEIIGWKDVEVTHSPLANKLYSKYFPT